MATHSVAVVGTAKNTGKTTTLKWLMDAAWRRGMGMAVTGIGYDGEEIDNVTGLPKPRIHCPSGCLVATAQRCIDTGEARLAVLEDTGIGTPLGEVKICGVSAAGRVVVSGPSKTADLRAVISRFGERGCSLALVDGAFGRLAPAAATGGVVLATGAARHRDMRVLAAETAQIVRTFGLEVWDGSAEFVPGRIAFFTTKVRRVEKPGSLLDEEYAARLARLLERDDAGVAISGACAARALEVFVERAGRRLAGKVLLLADCLGLLVGGDPLAQGRILDKMVALGMRVVVSRRIPLYGITLNPFYPDYRADCGGYVGGAVDAAELRRAVGARVAAPLFDAMKDDPGALLAAIMAEDGG